MPQLVVRKEIHVTSIYLAYASVQSDRSESRTNQHAASVEHIGKRASLKCWGQATAFKPMTF